MGVDEITSMPTAKMYTGERVRKYWCIFAILNHLSMSSVPSSCQVPNILAVCEVAAIRYGAFYTKLCHDLCEISPFYHDSQTTRCVSCDHAMCRTGKLHFPQRHQFRQVTLYLNQVDVIESDMGFRDYDVCVRDFITTTGMLFDL